MQIGLQVVSFDWPGTPRTTGPHLAALARQADQAGFYSMWVMDHYFQMEMRGQPDEPMLEAYTALSFLAGVTERIKLGTLVTGIIYREPAFLVKSATTLDVLSGGRAYLGIGAAWYEREALGLGFPFPPVKERFERLEETLQIVHHMWSGQRDPYHGQHYQLAEPINSPMPLTQPHPPIMIGGMGEKKTLRFVAKYADACNLFTFFGADQLAHKLEVLQQHCANEGRDYAEIEKTGLASANLAEQSAEEIIDFCQQMAELGIEHLIFNMPSYADLGHLEVFGERIIPAASRMS